MQKQAVQMQMFPGIQDLSLSRLLDRLQQPAPPLRVGRGSPPPLRLRKGSGFTNS